LKNIVTLNDPKDTFIKTCGTQIIDGSNTIGKRDLAKLLQE
jgi:hypothetical protein